jgi:hypothetical protein
MGKKLKRWELMSKHADITLADMDRHKNLPFNRKLFKNRFIVRRRRSDLLLRDKNKDNTQISIIILEKDVDWNDVCLYNRTITIIFIIRNQQIPWNYRLLSANPGLRPSEMFLYPEFPWDISMMSMNPNLTCYDVISHRDALWNWNSICKLRSGKYKNYKLCYLQDVERNNGIVVNSPSLLGLMFNLSTI